MYVKDYMTVNPVTTGPDGSISEAMEIMSANNFHRLPVVDSGNKLIGLLTGGVIRSHTPNNSSTLSVFELNYLLNKLKISDIMIKGVKTIDGDALLEEAATKMLENDIACLLVVDKKNQLEGIITQNDIFTAFINLLGYKLDATRYVIAISEDKVGIMEEIARCFKECDCSISNLAVYKTSRGIEVVVIAHGDESHQCEKKLISSGYTLTDIRKLNKEG